MDLRKIWARIYLVYAVNIDNQDVIWSINQNEAVSNQLLISEFHYYLKHRYELKVNHGEWVTTIKPDLSLGTSEMAYEAARTAEV
jgi:hypothetical protein